MNKFTCSSVDNVTHLDNFGIEVKEQEIVQRSTKNDRRKNKTSCVFVEKRKSDRRTSVDLMEIVLRTYCTVHCTDIKQNDTLDDIVI